MGSSRRPGAAAASPSDLEVGFAKLQGKNFEFYMQTYSIILGRKSRKKHHSCGDDADAAAPDDLDVDLGILDGGMNVSRRHARIFYDFARRRFALEVLGKNGCLVEGVLHVPGSPPVKLDSQDLLQMGDAQFYFLLPSRSVFETEEAARRTAIPRALPPLPSEAEEEEEEEEEEDGAEEQEEEETVAKRPRKGGDGAFAASRSESEAGPKGYREADNKQLLQLEEKDVISSAATVLSDLCGPHEWLPMSKLHEMMFQKYGDLWHHNKVRKYLTSEDWPEGETDGKPWHGLSVLIRKYPEHFVINIRKAGEQSTEFVSLVSLQP